MRIAAALTLALLAALPARAGTPDVSVFRFADMVGHWEGVATHEGYSGMREESWRAAAVLAVADLAFVVALLLVCAPAFVPDVFDGAGPKLAAVLLVAAGAFLTRCGWRARRDV